MRREDAVKLLGGYAAGTLTPAEREALLQAALADQDLFDTLVGEDALRELLEDPHARQRLLAALSEERPGAAQRFAGWFGRPAPWAVAGVLATAGLVAFFVVGPPKPPAAAPQISLELAKPAAEVPAAPQQALRRVTKTRTMAAVSDEADRGKPTELPGMRYSILREGKGAYRELAAGATLATGDRVRLAVVPHVEGQLTVWQVSGEGSLEQVYSAPAAAGVRYVVPAEGALELPPGEHAKKLRVSLIKAGEAAGRAVMPMLDARSNAAKAKVEAPPPAPPRAVEILIKYR